MPDPRTRPDEQFLDLNEDDSLSTEQLDNQVQKAQEQLIALKRAQETLEKQKRELEELSRRQEQLHQGKTEMIDKFTRAIVVLEREVYDAQKRWDGLDLNKELNKALSAVDDSRVEYNKSLPKINPESDTDSGDPIAATAGYQLDDGAHDAGKDFVYWLKAGFAFTLPLFAVGIIVIMLLISVLSNSK
jgi:hypothetical protein